MNVPVVPISSLVCMLLSVVLGVGFPVALAILWHKKTKAHVVSLVIGALTFLVFVYVLENALHQLCIYTDNGISRFLSSHMWAYILYGGLAAGVFEETGRLLAF